VYWSGVRTKEPGGGGVGGLEGAAAGGKGQVGGDESLVRPFFLVSPLRDKVVRPFSASL
jgi:hypothetical protein